MMPNPWINDQWRFMFVSLAACIDRSPNQKNSTTNPARLANTNPRSNNLLARMNTLPRKNKRVFSSNSTQKNSFYDSRKRIVRKLQNPRLQQISFHTLRHWKATMLYHQTKDILYVKQFLGHRKVETTLLYIQLSEVIFKNTIRYAGLFKIRFN